MFDNCDLRHVYRTNKEEIVRKYTGHKLRHEIDAPQKISWPGSWFWSSIRRGEPIDDLFRRKRTRPWVVTGNLTFQTGQSGNNRPNQPRRFSTGGETTLLRAKSQIYKLSLHKSFHTRPCPRSRNECVAFHQDRRHWSSSPDSSRS